MTSLSSVHPWTENFKTHKYTETGTKHFNSIKMFTAWWHPKARPSGRKEIEMRAENHLRKYCKGQKGDRNYLQSLCGVVS